jgi:mono/diheme cytochrome c family protein
MVAIKQLQGEYADGESRLWPLRVQHGVQPYDVESLSLVPVNLYGDEEAAFWQAMDWVPAIRTAMQAAGLGFSGNYDFVETEMVWPLNHGVAPAEDAVRCSSCHSRDGILAGLDGAYVPGRDYQPWLDWAGRILLGGTVLAILGHGTARGIAYRRRTNGNPEQENR